jgi:lipopolysaccharide assembly outer membrane protein LptD (OstA)
MRQKYGLFLFFFLLLPTWLFAQSQLEVIRADSLNGIQQDLIMRKTLIGHVFLRQGTTSLSCDQAVLNSTTNNVEAYGHVKIIQADTVTITGDTAI